MADITPYEEILRLSKKVEAMRALLSEWCALFRDNSDISDLLSRSCIALLPDGAPVDMCTEFQCASKECPECRDSGVLIGRLDEFVFYRCPACRNIYAEVLD